MTLKELLEIAKSNIRDLTALENPDIRLEQAEFNKEEKTWEVVISYLVENTNKRQGFSVLTAGEFEFDRLYKRLKIDENKNVIGLYMFGHNE